jgi:hypothetical protein
MNADPGTFPGPSRGLISGQRPRHESELLLFDEREFDISIQTLRAEPVWLRVLLRTPVTTKQSVGRNHK